MSAGMQCCAACNQGIVIVTAIDVISDFDQMHINFYWQFFYHTRAIKKFNCSKALINNIIMLIAVG
jgi:hypothetical protein